MCECIVNPSTRDNYELLQSMYDFSTSYKNTQIKCDICMQYDYINNEKIYITCNKCNKTMCSNCQHHVHCHALRALYNTCKCPNDKTHTNNRFSYSYCNLCNDIEIELICAKSTNNVIGCNNSIPWNVKGDMKYFYNTTINQIVIMGYNTYLSLPNKTHGLKNRINIVITTKNIQEPNIHFTTIENVFTLIKTINNKKIFAIGGCNIYKYFINYCKRFHLTTVHKVCDGDIYFPFSTQRLISVFKNKNVIESNDEYTIEVLTNE